MPEYSDKKPLYLDRVNNKKFMVERKKEARKRFGRVDKELRREILMIDGESGIKQDKLKRQIKADIFLKGEYPVGYDRKAFDLDDNGRLIDDYFHLTPFHCEAFWKDYYTYMFRHLDQSEVNSYVSEDAGMISLNKWDFMSSDQKSAYFRFYHGEQFTPIREMAGYKFERFGGAGYGGSGDTALALYRGWLSSLESVFSGMWQLDSIAVTELGYLSSVLPYVVKDMQQYLPKDRAAVSFGGGGIWTLRNIINPTVPIVSMFQLWEGRSARDKKRFAKPPTVEEVRSQPGYEEAHQRVLDFFDHCELPEHIRIVWDRLRESEADYEKIKSEVESEAWRKRFADLGSDKTAKEINEESTAFWAERKRAIQSGEIQPWPTGYDWVEHMHEKYGRFVDESD